MCVCRRSSGKNKHSPSSVYLCICVQAWKIALIVIIVLNVIASTGEPSVSVVRTVSFFSFLCFHSPQSTLKCEHVRSYAISNLKYTKKIQPSRPTEMNGFYGSHRRTFPLHFHSNHVSFFVCVLFNHFLNATNLFSLQYWF